MLDSIYTGLTGLAGYSKGLSVVSNNVANLNTAGFKGAQLQFADLYYKDSASNGDGPPAQVGAGLTTGGTFLNFQTGESRDTGNDLDLMIDGPGLFVLQQEDRVVYSRAGQFEFNTDGVLVDRMNGARLTTLGAGGALSEISLTGLRFSPPVATSTVELSGNLSIDDTQHVIATTTVYDSTGVARQVRITFDNINATTPGAWTVTVALVSDSTEIGTGELRFDAGRPVADHSTVNIAYAPASGGASIDFALHLSSDALSSVAGPDSTMQVLSQNGHDAGSLVQTSFNADGIFTTTYSNGQTEQHGRLAMAWFTSPDQIEQLGNNLFSYRDGTAPDIGHANAGGMGAIKSRVIELSNVDLAKQFSELIITQRGYQASSQVITTANEMIQQLMDMRGKR
jgi:flagellar hook protein FlgE